MRNKWLIGYIIFATSIALAVTLWSSYQAREESNCRDRVQAEFLSTIKARAVIGDGDRASVRTLFEEAVAAGKMKDPQKAQERSQAAIDAYFATQKSLDQLREDNPLPDPARC